MSRTSSFHGPNLGYVLELFDRYRDDPNELDAATRAFFANWIPPRREPIHPEGDFHILEGAVALARAIRNYGYLAANLDPLGSPPSGDRRLSTAFHEIREQDLRNISSFPALSLEGGGQANALQAVEKLRFIYCGNLGYDYSHIRLPEESEWLFDMAESGRFRPPQQPLDERRLLERLVQVEALEQFLHHRYPGKTRFSIEGLDILVPMLDEIVGAAARGKICAVLLGMSHRGRLNVQAHILKKPYRQILAEFADPRGRATTWDELGWTGDVKYHKGGYKIPGQDGDMDLVVHMPANPSHLEQIAPVIQGMARAANSKVDEPGAPEIFENASLPILIHGDASFPGQGAVAETLNLSRLPGYSTGGSIHIIANNQLGFTAARKELRSSLHASDLAKGFEMPVIHANADDPVACLEAARTAYAYRQKFHKDFVINLVGYRRYGHNEGDEPRFTQPVLYRSIDSHPTIREMWADRIGQPAGDDMLQENIQNLQEIDDEVDAVIDLGEAVPAPPPSGAAQKVKTAVPLADLKAVNASLLQFPEGFRLNPKLKRAVEKRRKLFDDPERSSVDWATAEELAFASILADGVSIRLTGEDTIRGTFSQRHAGFYDLETGEVFIPLQNFQQAKASFEIHNSPLSEAGVLGFEVGYNVQASSRLAIWEAQYGDFYNNAQTIVDEFLLAGRAKWGLTPSLAMLLPHGNEGMGPDHSSARIERFLGLAAEKNVRIAYPSTAAQYFHLLRRQALLLKEDPLPLVIFTPKGLLRHPRIASRFEEFTTQERWQSVLDDPEISPEVADSLILCSGRIYVDLVTSEQRKAHPRTAIARVEQLYPFPRQALQDLLDGFPLLERVAWVQEEPLNMGACDFFRPRLRQFVDRPLRYVGRPVSSSPAEGSSTLYRINQQTLIEQAFQVEEQTPSTSVVVERERG